MLLYQQWLCHLAGWLQQKTSVGQETSLLETGTGDITSGDWDRRHNFSRLGQGTSAVETETGRSMGFMGQTGAWIYVRDWHCTGTDVS